jgi:endonuclease/exonuclease/phosphatase family metal-dependent hydrolase
MTYEVKIAAWNIHTARTTPEVGPWDECRESILLSIKDQHPTVIALTEDRRRQRAWLLTELKAAGFDHTKDVDGISEGKTILWDRNEFSAIESGPVFLESTKDSYYVRLRVSYKVDFFVVNVHFSNEPLVVARQAHLLRDWIVAYCASQRETRLFDVFVVGDFNLKWDDEPMKVLRCESGTGCRPLSNKGPSAPTFQTFDQHKQIDWILGTSGQMIRARTFGGESYYSEEDDAVRYLSDHLGVFAKIAVAT